MSKSPIASEDQEQAALFQWASLQPSLALMYAVPNGGVRRKATAVRLKLTGVKAGVPDICLPVPRGGKHGLYIELKRRQGGRLSEVQEEWQRGLKAQGYAAYVCYGWEEAMEVITAYMGVGA